MMVVGNSYPTQGSPFLTTFACTPSLSVIENGAQRSEAISVLNSPRLPTLDASVRKESPPRSDIRARFLCCQ